MPENSPWIRFKHRLRAWRRGLKARLPYVRRREFRKVQNRYDQLLDMLGDAPRLATSVAMTALHQRAPSGRELCLFVSFTAQPMVKAHVRRHIAAFAAAGFDVALVLNTPCPADRFTLDDALRRDCMAVFVRENQGYDFAAWSHLASRLYERSRFDRVVLVNDSIIGPLQQAHFLELIQRIRRSPADVLGTTESIAPIPHLQSFFLVFQNEALHRGVFEQTMASIQNFRTKEMVIDVYETRLTQRLKDGGLRVEALFPMLSSDCYSANDTYFRWDELVAKGFPYLKISLLKEKIDDAQVRAALPADMLAQWEHEQ